MPANSRPPSPQPTGGPRPVGDSTGGQARLPFEPKKRQPAQSASAGQPPEAKKAKQKVNQKAKPAAPKTTPKPARTKATGDIPQKVSQRMVSRMVAFCGLPTVLGLMTFPVSYLVVSQGWFELPNVAVLLLSLGWFGLGVLGLSYGVLSASWDEERPGTWLGWEEFDLNFGRLRSSWRKEN